MQGRVLNPPLHNIVRDKSEPISTRRNNEKEEKFMNLAEECVFVSAIDDYQNGLISGRDLLRRVEMITEDPEQAAAVLLVAGFSYAELWARDQAPVPPAQPRSQVGSTASAVTIKPDDPSISVKMESYSGKVGTILGYLARPRKEGRYPGVIVIHENKGLVEHIKDVARRLAIAGYVALAPDLLSREGGTEHFKSLEDLQKALTQVPPDGFISDLHNSFDHLKKLPFVLPDKLGVTGFCFGGGLTWRLATQRQDLKAAVPFYGAAPPLEDVPKIKADVLAIYASLDERINSGIPALEAALKDARIRYQKVMYGRSNLIRYQEIASLRSQ